MAGVLTPVFLKGSPLSHINDNYLGGPTVKLVHQIQLDPQCQDKSVSSNISLDKFQTVNKVPLLPESRRAVYCPVVSPVRSVLSHGHLQKKGVSPGNCLNKIKSVKSVFCVDPCVFAPVVPSVPSAVSEHNVGGRLQEFWQVWQIMGSNPRVVSILKRGYTLPFKQRPVLTRFPVVQSGYANPSKNMHLKEALLSLMRKLVVEKVVVKSSLAFYNRLFLVPQTKWQMETNLRPKSFESLSQHRNIQDGNSGNNPLILEDGGVGHFAGLQRRLLPHPHSPKIKKVSQVLPVSSNFPVHSPAIRTGHSSPGVYQGGQRSETHGSSEGYQDPPVPRRLVTESPLPGNLPTTYPDPLGPMSAVRLGSKYDQVRVSSQTGLQFCRLPVRPDHRPGSTHSGPVGNPSGEIEVHERPSPVYGSTVHVLDRPPDGHRETSVCRSPSYEAHSVAPEETLACPGSPRESYSGPPVAPSSFGLVVGRGQCAERSTPAPSSARRSTIYRRLKRRLGRTLRRLHCKRRLVPPRRPPSYKFSRDESSPSGLTTVRASVQGSDCSCGNRQYYSGLLHKQTGGYEVRLSLCPPLETPVLVPSQRHNVKGKAHSGSLKCDSRQAFSAQSSDSDRMVSLPPGFQSVVFQVAPTASGLVCDQVQSQIAPVCVTGPGSGSLGSRCPELVLGASERLCIPSSLPAPSGSFKDKGSGLSQNDSDCPRLAKHALVWDLVDLSVQIPFTLPLTRDLVTQPFNGLVHRSLQNLNLHAWLLEALPSGNTASLKRWQHELRLLRGVQPEPCTSQSGPYLSSGVNRTRWTSGHPL